MSLIDIIGPVIIGPSSSHTAGAARIGKFTNNYCGGIPSEVNFILHGSFGSTYIGHGTDRALLGGIMGFEVSDIRIRDSFKFANEFNIKFSFSVEDLGDVHPNTVKINAVKNGIDYSVTGCSVGAGEIVINNIDGTDVNLKGKAPTLVIINKDVRGALGEILKIISSYGLNIANMNLSRIQNISKEATCIMELDEAPNLFCIQELSNSQYIISCKYISKIN